MGGNEKTFPDSVKIRRCPHQFSATRLIHKVNRWTLSRVAFHFTMAHKRIPSLATSQIKNILLDYSL